VTSGYRGAWWWTLRTVDPDGVIRLVGAILRGTPSLPGAACRGRYELHDEIPGQPTRRGVAEILQQRRTAAAALCQRCPVRAGYPLSRPGETKIPITGSLQVTGHFPQDHR
jgi:hypothetical protein